MEACSATEHKFIELDNTLRAAMKTKADYIDKHNFAPDILKVNRQEYITLISCRDKVGITKHKLNGEYELFGMRLVMVD
jgi:hypothetical protein